MPFRKVSRCHQDFIEIIYKVANILKLQDIEYEPVFGAENIDNFYGGVYKVEIKGKRDGQKIRQSVIIKWHPEPKLRNSFRESYRREYVFFQRFVPNVLKMQRRFNVEGLKMKFSNCIYASIEYDKETIAVSAAMKEGFKMLNRFYKTDLAHASLVMKNLAKLHALSFALEKLNPREFEEIKALYQKDIQYADPDRVSKSMESYFHASINVVSDPAAKQRLEEITPDFLLILNRCTMPVPYSVICHADCWINNNVFKYQRTRPVDILLVDYQLSRYASPVTDISYFFYMSTEKDLLSNHYNQLIDIYYKTLSAVLRQCDLNVAEVYPKSVFERHLKEYSVLGLIEALVSMKIITAATEEAFEMTEKKYSSTANEFSDNVSQNQTLYVERVNGVVNDFFERKYSLDAVLN